jgi:peptide/nickel transport system substrate-binding protein
VAVAVAVMLAASGCSGSEVSPQNPAAARPHPGGRLAYGIEADPNGLNPVANAWDTSGIQIANAVFDPLAAYDVEGRAQPYLAKSFEASDDYRTWTVRLRPGVQFHDGTPLDANAIVTWSRALRGSLITGPPASMIEDVVAVDDLTVRLTCRRPWASLPALLTGQGGYIPAASQLNSAEGSSKPAGTGPFILERWDINERFVLRRNPHYWREGLPYLDSVEFDVVEDGGRRVDLLARGDLDVISVGSRADRKVLDDYIGRQETSDAASGPRVVVKRDPGDGEKSSVLFNTTKAPLDDVRVRQAIAYATDINALASRNGWPADELARGPISRNSPYFAPADYPAFGIDKAKALIYEYLADPDVRSQGKTGVSFTISVGPGTMGISVMQQLIDMWAKAGINARLEIIDLKMAVRLAVSGNYEALSFRYFASPDPDVFWHFFVGDTLTPDQPAGLSLNFAHLSDDEITAGMNEGRSSADPAVRKAAYAKVQEGFAREMPYLWLTQDQWELASTIHVRDARNVTLPDGATAMPYVAGTHRLAETWLDEPG